MFKKLFKKTPKRKGNTFVLKCDVCQKKYQYHVGFLYKLKCIKCQNPINTTHLLPLVSKDTKMSCGMCRQTHMYCQKDKQCISCGSNNLRTELKCENCNKSTFYTWNIHMKKGLPPCYNCNGRLAY